MSHTYLNAAPLVAISETQTLLIESLRASAAAYARGLKYTMLQINCDEDLSAIVNQRLRRVFCADDIPPKMQEHGSAEGRAGG